MEPFYTAFSETQHPLRVPRFALVALALAGCLATAPLSAAEPAVPAKAPAATPAAKPLEVYKYRCMQIVAQRWKEMVDNTEDKSVFTGVVTVQFEITPEGRPKHFEILDQTKDAAAIRRTSLYALGTTRFPAIFPEALKQLEGKPLKIKAKFSLGK